jgi:hypothetical protein
MFECHTATRKTANAQFPIKYAPDPALPDPKLKFAGAISCALVASLSANNNPLRLESPPLAQRVTESMPGRGGVPSDTMV